MSTDNVLEALPSDPSQAAKPLRRGRGEAGGSADKCLIKAVGLTKRFGKKLAVDDLTFEVHPGQVTGFLGPNGAGKSTAMRLMLGLDGGGGRTTFDGVPYRELRDPAREVGALLEAKAFHPTRSARNHLRMLAAPSRISDRRVDEVLELVGLASVAGKGPKSFSLGMSQRLGLAVALLGDPRVLILDEPANGLDPQGINWLRIFLQSFAESGRTVLVSSHQLAEMAQMADHLVVIGRGRLISDLPTDEFESRWSLKSVSVQSPQSEQLRRLLIDRGATVQSPHGDAFAVTGLDQAQIGDVAAGAGIVLHELATRVASLEEAFLEATADAQEHPIRTTSDLSAA
ncbi:MAG: type transport system ATP-binding protein [Frankiaceae bacterium]|nr:type transport system ATP-binding protein [Frankiaceae bacterium]